MNGLVKIDVYANFLLMTELLILNLEKERERERKRERERERNNCDRWFYAETKVLLA